MHYFDIQYKLRGAPRSLRVRHTEKEMGLELALAHIIAEHRGQLEVDRNLGGSSFENKVLASQEIGVSGVTTHLVDD